MKHRTQSGGVIVEVLIAAVIFAITMLALVEFQTNLLRERGLLNQELYALNTAQDKMQYFRSYTKLATTSGFFAYADIVNGTDTVTDAATSYTRTWTVTDSAVTDLPVRKTVNIAVTWTDPITSTTNTVSINSIIAQIDPTGTGKVSQGLP